MGHALQERPGSGYKQHKVTPIGEFVMAARKQIPDSEKDLFAHGEQLSYTGDALKEIAFPLGGIGAGIVSLGGRGRLRDWEVSNRR
jgi:hypothetical protein